MDTCLIEDFKKVARENLEQCVAIKSDFCALAFVHSENGSGIIPMTFQGKEEKAIAYQALGSVMAVKNISEVLLIADSFVREAADQAEVDLITEHYDTESPSVVSEDKRGEAIVITLVDFKNGDKIWTIPYERILGQAIFKPEEEMSGPISDGLIRDSIVSGFIVGKFKDTKKDAFDVVKNLAAEYKFLIPFNKES